MKFNSLFLSITALLFNFSLSTVLAGSDIKIPFIYAKGKTLFEASCASCHGLSLSGTDNGPPLLHPYYKPSHHGDQAFYNAALKGVTAHHWKFGDMPRVAGMTEQKIKSIVPYVRYFQKQSKLY